MKKIVHLLVWASFVFTWNACTPDDPVTRPDASKNKTEATTAALANEYFAHSIGLTKSTAGFSPPVAARSYGYLGLALYEAVVGGMSDHKSLQGVIQGLKEGDLPAPEAGKTYHWGECANRALSVMMLKLYSIAALDSLSKVTATERKYELQFEGEVDEETFQRSKDYGTAMAEAVFRYASSDGQSHAYTSNFPAAFTAPVFTGAWVPTPPAFQKIPLQPYWGLVRTFHPNSVLHSQPVRHPDFSTDPASAFYKDAYEVLTVSQTLTAEQQGIAEYWSDDPGKTGTPPGHSISIARQVLQKENANLALAAEVYAKVGMAVHDAFVSCWKCKYDFNLMRPVTYIRQYLNQPGWNSLLATPPFPEYSSGHSVQSGATAVVLSELFGYNYGFTDATHAARQDINGAPRTFRSFTEAADQAAISRLYGGIHYRFGIDFGVEQGKKVGKLIADLPMKK
jgi:hypothetical protein